MLTGDVIQAIIIGLIENLHLPTPKLQAQILTDVQIFPLQLILLVMAIFYPWADVMCLAGEARKIGQGDSTEEPASVQPA